MESPPPAYTPKPYAERASQHIGWGDYLRKHVSVLLMPFVMAGVGYAVGRTQKMEPLNLENKEKLGLVDGYKLYMHAQFGGENKGKLFAAYGLKVGTAIAAYIAWTKKEKKRLEVADVVASVKEVAPLHQTNEDLLKDNAIVEKMIAFEQEKQASYREQLEKQSAQGVGMQK